MQGTALDDTVREAMIIGTPCTDAGNYICMPIDIKKDAGFKRRRRRNKRKKRTKRNRSMENRKRR